ncbi:SRPBCC domain-containing protein [Rhizobium sp. IMFF44]|uniref:SRPBCC family protein n=1 Tax=Rhizobium sp. IMFF44 TaxID=3342350 RepID=UPI0035B70939
MKAASGEVRAVVVEREIPHPPAKVWRALTQPHLMAEWLMKNDFVPIPGHRFSFRSDWGGVLDCEVLVVEPNARLSYRWNFAHDDPAFDLRSVVTFTLAQTDKGTHLRMEQIGFRPDQKQAYGGAKAGWRQFLERLEQVLAEVK